MMIRNILLLGILLASVLAYTWLDSRSDAQRAAPIPDAATQTQRQHAPDFTFKTLDGKAHALKDFAGKPVILNFWASWCAPCVIEFPAMLQLAQKTDSVFIFLSQDENDAEISRFIKRYGKDLPLGNVYIARDENKETAQKLYQTFKLPETYIIDNGTNIAEKIIGADIDWAGEEMRQKVKTLSLE